MEVKLEMFARWMATELKLLLPQCVINVREQRKTNDVIWQGVSIRHPGENTEAVYYLEECYKDFQKGKNIKVLAEALCEHYLNNVRRRVDGVGRIFDFEEVCKSICYSLVNPMYNQEDLKDRPHEPFMDLVKVYEIDAGKFMKEGEHGKIAIRDSMLEVWHIGEVELKRVAEENTPRLKPACLLPMKAIMEELTGNEPDFFSEIDPRMYVLTNENREYGAACLAYPGMEKVIADTVGEDYVVLPSSVHELIILSEVKEPIDIGEMERMIKDINESQVPKEDWLGEHPYRYDKTLGVILPVYAGERKKELQEVKKYEGRRR